MDDNTLIINLPSIFENKTGPQVFEILAASMIISTMLWPNGKDDKHRTLYMTLCLKKVHSCLLAEQPQNADEVFNYLLGLFKLSPQGYSDNLYLANFPHQGKGSIQERAQQGYLTGTLLEKALFSEEPISLNDAAKWLSEGILNEHNQEIGFISENNLIRNYWSRFKNVAHFWCALSYFTLPEPSDSLIRIDKAIPEEAFAGYGQGWRGIVAVANALLEKSLNVKRTQTNKLLLDPEKSLKVIFSDIA